MLRAHIRLISHHCAIRDAVWALVICLGGDVDITLEKMSGLPRRHVGCSKFLRVDKFLSELGR
jgi:hypothetical protein